MFSGKNRTQDLIKCQSDSYDLIIIGGGITGCGIALDAASRGFKTLLLEQLDFASGTSSKSTKLIHGGLRYLKQLEIGLVHESGTERAVVHQLVPNLCLPQKMLLPLVEGGSFGKFSTSLGLWVYDFLADVKKEDRRDILTPEETLEKEPLLNPSELVGGGYYAEYRTDDARLTIEILKKAVEHRATAFNYCKVIDFVYNANGTIIGLKAIDQLSSTTLNFKSKIIVSAAGPWVDEIRKINNSINHKKLHLTKGVHLVVPHSRLPIRQSIYFEIPDGRMIFAIPRDKTTYIGTTDTNYTGSKDNVRVTEADRDYLLKATNRMFPGITLTPDDCLSCWAGLRPLIHEDGKSPSELSRKDEIFEAKDGLISIAGGKLTGYRKMAKRIVDRLRDILEDQIDLHYDKCQTRNIKLGHFPFENVEEVSQCSEQLKQEFRREGLNEEDAEIFLFNYGKATDEILIYYRDFKTKNPLNALILAELKYTLTHEMVLTPADFFARRSGRLYFDIKSVYSNLESVISYLSEYFESSEIQITNYRKEMEQQLFMVSHYAKEDS